MGFLLGASWFAPPSFSVTVLLQPSPINTVCFYAAAKIQRTTTVISSKDELFSLWVSPFSPVCSFNRLPWLMRETIRCTSKLNQETEATIHVKMQRELDQLVLL